jgi:hypothetical protein
MWPKHPKNKRAHLRFCCVQCDRAITTRLFDAHRAYRERLHPAATLYRVTVDLVIGPLRALKSGILKIRLWKHSPTGRPVICFSMQEGI